MDLETLRECLKHWRSELSAATRHKDGDDWAKFISSKITYYNAEIKKRKGK